MDYLFLNLENKRMKMLKITGNNTEIARNSLK